MSLGSCGGDDEAPVEARFELLRDGAETGFFDLPWPTDLRTSADGTLDVRDFPNPRGPSSTLAKYIEVISSNLTGWGTNGAIYFHFSGPIAADTLPASAAATADEGASAFLLDLDDGSRHPVNVHYEPAQTVYWPGHTVALRPVWGMPLLPDHTYAAVITDAVRTAGGNTIRRSADLEALLGEDGDDAVTAARTVYGPAVDALEAAGIGRDAILSLAVFTTQDPTRELALIRDWMMAEYTEPAAIPTAWEYVDDNRNQVIVEGRYGPAPIFQSGQSPYDDMGSGEIEVRDGVPVVAGEFEARFMLSVPTSPMPPGGYPIVLYAHGTYGDYESFVQDGTADELAREGYAVMGIDQVLHGERNPGAAGSEDLLFFNFLNPMAGRDNNRQAALDVVQQARFARVARVPNEAIGVSGRPEVRFNPDRMYVYGHSQGGLNLPLFMAIDDQTKGGLLSGAGATLSISVIEKKDPFDLGTAVQLFLQLPGATATAALELEAFSYDHPVLSLLQTWVEPSDGSNYGPMIIQRPREGFMPKSLLMTGAQDDAQTTANANASLAAAIGVPVIEPAVAEIEANTLRSIAPQSAPATRNMAGGAATGGIIQYAEGGHFIVFNEEPLKTRIRGYFRSFADGVPTIPGGEPLGPRPDAGMFMEDAGADGGADAGADAGVEPGTDAGVDAGADAGVDASADAAADAG